MTIKDSMHQTNVELTAEFASELLTQTSKDIEAHSVQSWELARPLQLLFALDAEVFG